MFLKCILYFILVQVAVPLAVNTTTREAAYGEAVAKNMPLRFASDAAEDAVIGVVVRDLVSHKSQILRKIFMAWKHREQQQQQKLRSYGRGNSDVHQSSRTPDIHKQVEVGEDLPPGTTDQNVHVHSTTKNSSKNDATVCALCPDSEVMRPCSCACSNSTVAQLTCGADLLSCEQLTGILTMVDFPTNIYLRMVIGGTQLQCNLQEDMWGPLTFRELMLMNNEFHTIDNHAFVPFKNTLRLLNLEKNSLKQVFYATLSDQPLLEEIRLNNNELGFFPGYSAITLDALRILKLNNNHLTQVSSQTFAGLPRLEHLDLSNNQIDKLCQNAFSIPNHQAELLKINLSFNNLSYLKSNLITGVKNATINLQHNMFTSLTEASFRPLIDVLRGNVFISVVGNLLSCDCHFSWILTNKTVINSFDNFRCSNLNNAEFSSLTLADLGDCVSPESRTL